MTTSNDLRDELLTWLQEKKDTLKFSLGALKNSTQPIDRDAVNVLKGQLDSYLQVTAFIMSEGKLR